MRILILVFLLGSIAAYSLQAQDTVTYLKFRDSILVHPDLQKIEEYLKSGIDPNQTVACGGYKPLNAAVNVGNPEVVDLLLRYGAKPDHQVLEWAAFVVPHDSALKIVKAFVKAGTPVTTEALSQAVWRQNTELIAFLLTQKGYNINGLNQSGETALMSAIDHGNKDIVEMLLKAGADPAVKDRYGRNSKAISEAVIANQKEIQSLFKEK